MKYREIIADVRRVVVKIGSRVLVQKTGRPDKRRIRSLTNELASIQKNGHEVVIVTSGAVGAGMEALGMSKRPVILPDLQMAAAIGQARLMATYGQFFGALNCKVGQILLTHADFRHRMRLTNARRVIENLIRNRVIPIINENDVVADEEIRADLTLGDNDLLAGLVVRLVRADLLIMLTTVDGLRENDKFGRTRRVKYLESITHKTFKLVTEHDGVISKGGMLTKLKAAKAVSQLGCAAVIANGRQTGVLTAIMSGKDIGTMVVPTGI
ncbi:MAG: glutamate 5-kinase [Lentisphaerae bacterium]|nr:glutamate 5-kinase [Lentisphaerota bacterium]